jgi:hypothetical protein
VTEVHARVVSATKARNDQAFNRNNCPVSNVLRGRIQAVNNDNNAEYTISEAVAFGDFLSQDARVQPAEVGIRLTRRKTDLDGAASAVKKGLQCYLISGSVDYHPEQQLAIQ